VDRRAGKPLEINYLSGALVRLGEKFGVPAPTHKFIMQALYAGAVHRRRWSKGIVGIKDYLTDCRCNAASDHVRFEGVKFTA
jgi:hypothetical protein